jgi:secondary thiamine-phosphate synthase enzyme
VPAQTELSIATDGPGFTEITGPVAAWCAGQAGGQGPGLLSVFVRHSSASLLIQENADPDVRRDLVGFLNRLAPPADDPAMHWLTHLAEGPDDMPAHLKAAVLPTSLTVPVRDGRLLLGTWQGIYLVEHRDAPHRRKVVLTLV